MLVAPSEPSIETFQEIGRLCFLELQTELTLVGLLSLNERQTRTFVWRMGITDRWKTLVNVADEALPKEDAETLRTIGKQITKCGNDRNIIVHGLVHASAKLKPDQKQLKIIPHEGIGTDQLVRVPCWTVFMGEGKGKNYPIAKEAVSIVIKNIQKFANQLAKFNEAHNFRINSLRSETIEKDSPKLL
jgi:hypothetical protein